MRQSRGSKVETEVGLYETEARPKPNQLKKTASRPPRAEADASWTPSLEVSLNLYMHDSWNARAVSWRIYSNSSQTGRSFLR